jgi:fructose-bisphosphate aldolase class II
MFFGQPNSIIHSVMLYSTALKIRRIKTMSLTSLKPLLEDATKRGYAIGAFNVVNIEMIRGVIQAAEHLNSPVILQLAEVHLPSAPIEYMAPVMIEAAHRAKVPVSVHFDHGTSFESIALAIKHGFTSVMFDGANHSLEENIKLTKEVVQLGKALDVTVEAELGQVGGAEGGNKNIDAHLTDIEEARTFTTRTLVDALAVSIGNLHGQYIEEPKLRFDRLKQLREYTDTPLVLHGGSGISPMDFRACIQQGIHKINIGTALQLASSEKIKSFCDAHSIPAYFSIMDLALEGTYEAVKEHLQIFMSNDKA